MWRSASRAVLALTVLATSAHARPEPWSDEDGLGEKERHAFGDYGLSLGAEYRSNWLYVNPLSLSSESQRRAHWLEHRLRLDATVDYDEKVRLVLSIDGLDGTLWGDNGTFGNTPSTNSGVRAASSNPNNAKPRVGYLGGDELDPDNYGYVLEASPPLKLRRAYGEVALPIGILRVGRQPTIDMTGILVASGDDRRNRFGFANAGDSSDRILFATKPLEAFKSPKDRDLSPDRGLVTGIFYDRTAGRSVHLFGDNVHSSGGVVRYLHVEPTLRAQFEVQGLYSHRWETEFDTDLNIVGLRGIAQVDRLTVGADGIFVFGKTRELSEALSLIHKDPIVSQNVRQLGARAVARWDEELWTAYLEVDYASGDRDPNPGSDLTQLYFAEDANVGLLMFERILAFESARSSAAGVVLLNRINAPTVPAERVDSEGSFTNAIAIFPQADVRPHPKVLLRGGVLMAWAPDGLVDPIESLKRRDGLNIEDDLINYHGGKPGNFYGVELDGRFQWNFLDHFLFDLEGAILFPGDALEDENGQATRSVLVQARTTFVF